MSNDLQPRKNSSAPTQPAVFDELPFSKKCRVFIRERYRTLSWPNKIGIWLVLVAAVLAPLALTARPLLRQWKQANTLRAARQYAKAGDVAAALKAYGRALRQSTKADEWREFATFADQSEAGNTVALWEKVTELDPNSMDGWMGAMEAAIKNGDTTGALKIFQQAPADVAARPEMQITRGSALVLAGRRDAARSTLHRALAAAPQEPKSRLGLALLALDVGDETQKLQGRQLLEELTRDTSDEIRLPALRALLRGYREEKLRVSGIDVARRIIEDPTAPFLFRLNALGTLIDWNAPDLDGAVRTVGDHALKSEGHPRALVEYLLARDRGAIAWNWTQHLLNNGVPREQVSRLEADIALSDTNWPAFISSVEASGAFAGLPDLLPRLIEIAKGHSADPTKALEEWTSTLDGIDRPGPEMEIVAAIANRFDWQMAVAAALERDAALRPGDPVPLRNLASYYQRTLDLKAFQRALDRLVAVEPGNLSAANGALHARLLLGDGNPADNLAESERYIARDPQNPELLTTRAMALYRAGRFRDAAEIFERMQPDAANHPDRALYRGLIYAETGESEAALREFERARPAVERSFPEVKTLLSYGERRAQSRLQRAMQPAPPSGAAPRSNQR